MRVLRRVDGVGGTGPDAPEGRRHLRFGPDGIGRPTRSPGWEGNAVSSHPQWSLSYPSHPIICDDSNATGGGEDFCLEKVRLEEILCPVIRLPDD